MPQPYVHSFYKVWFTIVDPVVVFITALKCIFSPAAILEKVVPPSVEFYRPLSHGPLFHQAAMLWGFSGVIYGVLLRASPDPKVWRIVQAAILGVDISLLTIFYDMLRLQGRLDLGAWHSGDWLNIGFTVLVGLFRVTYLMGVGGDRERTEREKEN